MAASTTRSPPRAANRGRRGAVNSGARHAAGHRRLALDPPRHRARAAPCARRRRRGPRAPPGHRDLQQRRRRLGRALHHRGRRRADPTRSSSSSAPTRATGCPGPAASEVECCGADYAAVFANRVRQVMDTFRQNGAAKVYWLTVMTPRDDDAARVSKVVNAVDQGRRPAMGRPGPDRRHGPGVHPGRALLRLDLGRRQGRRSSGSPTGST